MRFNLLALGALAAAAAGPLVHAKSTKAADSFADAHSFIAGGSDAVETNVNKIMSAADWNGLTAMAGQDNAFKAVEKRFNGGFSLSVALQIAEFSHLYDEAFASRQDEHDKMNAWPPGIVTGLAIRTTFGSAVDPLVMGQKGWLMSRLTRAGLPKDVVGPTIWVAQALSFIRTLLRHYAPGHDPLRLKNGAIALDKTAMWRAVSEALRISEASVVPYSLLEDNLDTGVKELRGWLKPLALKAMERKKITLQELWAFGNLSTRAKTASLAIQAWLLSIPLGREIAYVPCLDYRWEEHKGGRFRVNGLVLRDSEFVAALAMPQQRDPPSKPSDKAWEKTFSELEASIAEW